MLREHAGPGDHWILDALRDDPPGRCPRADLSNMLALESSGHDRAYVVWPADDVDACVAALRPGLQRTVLSGSIAEFAGQTHLVGTPQIDPAEFAVFAGTDSEIVLEGDTAHTFQPAHSRTLPVRRS